MKYNVSLANAKRVAFYTIKTLSIVILVIIAFSLGYQRGAENPKSIVIENVINIEDGDRVGTNFGVFWEAWDLLKEKHIKGAETEDQDLVYGAVRGLVNSVGDPNTIFLPPDDSKKFEEDVSGNFGGIGAEIGVRDGQLVIIAPLKGTPAERAGLKAGDKIVAVNEESTHGIDINEAVKKIRGEIGTEVALSVFRDGWERAKDFKIIRANIQVPTLEWELITSGDKKLAHVKLFSFNQNASSIFYKTILAALVGGKSDGMILDLRNNPGGFLEVAVNLSGWFLDKGAIVVSERFRDGEEIIFRAQGNEALRNFPTVILVNKGSASASEILAGALRAHLGIKLIGEKTFGKGTVQELRSLSDNSKVKLTIANWVLPDGTIIEKDGLKPDFEVEIEEEDVNDLADGGEEKKDPQLEKAIEVLLGEIKN